MTSSPEEIAALTRGPMCRDCGGYMVERADGVSHGIVCLNYGCEAFGKLILAKTVGTPAPVFGPRPWAPGEIVPRHVALLNLIEGHLRIASDYLTGGPYRHVRDAHVELEELRGILKRRPPPPPDVPAELAEARGRERRNLYRAAWTIVLLGALALVAIARLL